MWLFWCIDDSDDDDGRCVRKFRTNPNSGLLTTSTTKTTTTWSELEIDVQASQRQALVFVLRLSYGCFNESMQIGIGMYIQSDKMCIIPHTDIEHIHLNNILTNDDAIRSLTF